jgi:DNA invertase Pin-like site-specific DNA recombinase
MVLLYGRRRVGKSTLLRHWAEQSGAPFIYTVAQHPEWHLADEHLYRDDGYSGAKLNRSGLDRLRDRAAFAPFEVVLLTAPDHLARNYVHQMLLIDELAQRGCQVVFLDRPMNDDPHGQLQRSAYAADVPLQRDRRQYPDTARNLADHRAWPDGWRAPAA